MALQFDDLRGMQVFAAAVEAGSFAGAARALGLTRSAVSKYVAGFESQHGVRLLQRTTRSLRLTDEGARLFPHCVAMLGAAERALQTMEGASSSPTGTLRVTAPAGLARHLVAPVAAALVRDHPALSIEIHVADGLVDLVGTGIDVAVRGGVGQLADSPMVARRIAPLSLMLCASADYVDRCGLPADPSELSAHDWIGFGPLASRDIVLDGESGREHFRPNPRLACNHGESLIALLRAGAGIALVPRFSVAAALRRAEIVEVLPGWRPPAGTIFAVYPPNPFLPSRTRTFIDRLAVFARDSE